MNNQIVEILVEKAINDIKELKIEAKNRGLESQIELWVLSYMYSLQKTNAQVHEIVLERLR